MLPFIFTSMTVSSQKSIKEAGTTLNYINDVLLSQFFT